MNGSRRNSKAGDSLKITLPSDNLDASDGRIALFQARLGDTLHKAFLKDEEHADGRKARQRNAREQPRNRWRRDLRPAIQKVQPDLQRVHLFRRGEEQRFQQCAPFR